MSKYKKDKKKEEVKKENDTRKVWVPSQRKWLTIQEYNDLFNKASKE